MSGKWVMVVGAVLGALAVMTGAFGAHALKSVLSESAQNWYGTAVNYHAQHAMALIICGVMIRVSGGNRWLSTAAITLLTGTLIFSGSLYLMAFTSWALLGMLTPVGGLLLIIGWLSLAIGALRM